MSKDFKGVMDNESVLKESLLAIFSQKSTKISFEQIYTAVYKITLKRKSSLVLHSFSDASLSILESFKELDAVKLAGRFQEYSRSCHVAQAVLAYYEKSQKKNVFEYLMKQFQQTLINSQIVDQFIHHYLENSSEVDSLVKMFSSTRSLNMLQEPFAIALKTHFSQVKSTISDLNEKYNFECGRIKLHFDLDFWIKCEPILKTLIRPALIRDSDPLQNSQLLWDYCQKDMHHFTVLIDSLSNFIDNIELHEFSSFVKLVKQTQFWIDLKQTQSVILQTLSKKLARLSNVEASLTNYIETDENLQLAFTIYKMLINQDIFEVCFRQVLGRRILSGDTDVHEQFVSLMKNECYDTKKMEGMLNDREFVTKFGKVNVLTSCFWPISAPKGINFGSVESETTVFEKEYRKEYSGRKLNWTCFGSAVIQYRDNIIHCSTLQMLILMLFNAQEKHTLEDIAKNIGITEDLACRNLACMIPLIVRNADKTEYVLNPNFISKTRRIKFHKPKSDKPNLVSVLIDRRTILEANVTRILKARKKLSHSNLITEILSTKLRFQPTVNDIKRAIESLIEKEYLGRKGDKYIYIS